jgi:hypothetical protein
MTRNPLVAIIVINYRGREDTLECLTSLQALTYAAVHIYVVDQPFGPGEKERDGTPEAIRERFPHVVVIENPVNNGFAGGNNVGMRQALADGAEYLFLLNNDTTVDPGLIEPMVALAESDARIGVVGPTMLYYDFPEVVWSVGGEMGAQGQSVLVGEGKRIVDISEEAAEYDFIVGCGLLAKRRVLETVGLFDERYFLYYEEADLCARVRRAGWQMRHQPKAKLWHKISRSTGTESELTLYYMRRNVLIYLTRHQPKRVFPAILDHLRLACVWRLQGKHRRCHVLLRALWDFLRGRGGKTDFIFQK